MAQYVPGPPDTVPGLPVNGLTGQYLRKKTDADYDTEWASAGGGGGGITYLADIVDVDTTQVVDGSVLVYNASTSTYVAGPLDTRLTLTDGGAF